MHRKYKQTALNTTSIFPNRLSVSKIRWYNCLFSWFQIFLISGLKQTPHLNVRGNVQTIYLPNFSYSVLCSLCLVELHKQTVSRVRVMCLHRNCADRTPQHNGTVRWWQHCGNHAACQLVRLATGFTSVVESCAVATSPAPPRLSSSGLPLRDASETEPDSHIVDIKSFEV